MKKFIKTVFASCLGVILAFFLLIMVVVVVALCSDSSSEMKDSSVLLVSLDGEIVDREDDDVYVNLFPSQVGQTGLSDIRYAIQEAKKDDRIKGIYLKTNVLQTGYATLEEIRDALADFKSSGKFIYAYSGLYTQGAYYVASVADSLFMNPRGSLDFTGISSSSLFCKDFLTKIGVEMQVVKAGSYKSYAESYVNDSMSSENREQMDELLSSIWNSIVDSISISRSIEKDRLLALADSMIPLRSSSYVLEQGFVDGLLFNDQFESLIRSKLDVDSTADLPTVSVKDYVADLVANKVEEKTSDKVAILYLNGEIDNGSTDGISSPETVKQLRKLGKDSTVKAVVLRVNSPGGSAYGSDQICHAIMEAKKSKPIIASMGDYAASGGYYIASNASRIFSDKNTVTGSIGVIALLPNAQELSNKIGVHYETVKTNRNADVMENIFRPLNTAERAAMQRSVDDFYDTFLQRCAEGRGMEVEQVKEYAEGRVWSGIDALKIGLVDYTGGLRYAIDSAAAMAKLTDYSVVEYPEKKDFFQKLQEIPSIGYEKLKENEVFSKERYIFEKIRNLERFQAIMPYTIELR
ncbi:MAG: signal peptide peptidase SppA [Paludibacteraceae bacterium]|nr:signal peptide peptidase SppA [Paludibacteraceae bacterium]